MRVWQFTNPTVGSVYDLLVQADDDNSIFFMESYRFGYIDFTYRRGSYYKLETFETTTI